ncbi:MAG: ABC transporter substrate-binding protein [Acidimicrobiales bacterium]
MGRTVKRCFLLAAASALLIGVTPALAGAAKVGTINIPGVKLVPSKATPKPGGTVTVLLGSGFLGHWTSLGVTNPAFNDGFEDAVYGTLFGQLRSGKIIPQLATGYKVSNGGKTYTISLRHDVTFSDGTPFNAAAVIENFNLDVKSDSLDSGDFPTTSVTSPNQYTVVFNLKFPDGAFIDAFPGDTPNWIESPAHLATLKDPSSPSTVDLFPVGAGPFKITADVPNVSLTMVRNPAYWDQPYPYLDKIIFKTVGNDSSALAAVQSNEAQVYSNYGEYQNVRAISNSVNVYSQSAFQTTIQDIQFNTKQAPFNNIKARDAIAYATNVPVLNKALFDGQAAPSQAPLGPGSTFWEKTVPGTRTYNLAQAKALVKQLGHLNVNLLSMNGVTNVELDDALQSQWKRAGITTTISAEDETTMLTDVTDNKWQIAISDPGSEDPGVGFGIYFQFGSNGFNSGVKDPHLDAMLQSALEPLTFKARLADYDAIYKYISDKEYGIMLFVTPLFTLTTKSVTFSTSGLGLFAPPLQTYYETLAYKK